MLKLIGTVALQGHGKVTLTDDPGNVIESNGSSCELDNVNNTISGAGTLGDANTALVNAGTINGTGKNPLIIDAPAGIANTGTMESSSTGGLEIAVNVGNGAGGVVAAAASGSHIDLNNSSISSGSVKSVAGSTIDTVAGTTDAITGASFSNAGTLMVSPNSTFILGNNVNNMGTIALDSKEGVATLEVSGAESLTGTGKVVLSGLGPIIVSNGSPATLTNVSNTISGDGIIGGGDPNLTLVNDTTGVINANAEQLELNPGSTITNEGMIECTNGALLTVGSPIANSGTLECNGGSFELLDSLDNTGKVVADSGGFQIVQTPSGTGSLAIGGSGEIEFLSSATGIDENVTFSSGAAGRLVFEAAATTTPTTIYDGTISGFGPNDSIDLGGLSFTFASTTVSPPVFSAGNTTVTVTNGTDTVALTFAGNLTSDTFVVGDDGDGGTRLTDPVAKTTGTHVASSPITMLASRTNDQPLMNGASNVALLGNYMASTFATAEGQVVAPMSTETAQSLMALAHPHAG